MEVQVVRVDDRLARRVDAAGDDRAERFHVRKRRAARLQHRADGCADLRRHVLRRRVGEGDGDLCAELQRLVQQADLDVGPADINADLIHVRLLFSLILRLHHAA